MTTRATLCIRKHTKPCRVFAVCPAKGPDQKEANER
jgi:hypothetical protein